MTFFGLCCISAGVTLIACGVAFYCHREWMKDRELCERTDWEANRWLDSKHTLLGTWK